MNYELNIPVIFMYQFMLRMVVILFASRLESKDSAHGLNIELIISLIISPCTQSW